MIHNNDRINALEDDAIAIAEQLSWGDFKSEEGEVEFGDIKEF